MFAFGSWQGTAGSQRLELTVANVGTTGHHCKELPVPRDKNSWFLTWEPMVLNAVFFYYLSSPLAQGCIGSNPVGLANLILTLGAPSCTRLPRKQSANGQKASKVAAARTLPASRSPARH